MRQCRTDVQTLSARVDRSRGVPPDDVGHRHPTPRNRTRHQHAGTAGARLRPPSLDRDHRRGLPLLVVINGIAGAVGPDYRTDFTLPGQRDQGGAGTSRGELARPRRLHLSDRLPRTARGRPTPRCRRRWTELFDYVAGIEDITVTSPYDAPQQVSQDGTIALRPARHRRHPHVHRADRRSATTSSTRATS